VHFGDVPSSSVSAVFAFVKKFVSAEESHDRLLPYECAEFILEKNKPVDE